LTSICTLGVMMRVSEPVRLMKRTHCMRGGKGRGGECRQEEPTSYCCYDSCGPGRGGRKKGYWFVGLPFLFTFRDSLLAHSPSSFIHSFIHPSLHPSL
jgi:hypothetical protein